MKKAIFSILCLCGTLNLLNGQIEGLAQNAVIFFYRPHSFSGSTVRMKILVDGQPVVLLKKGSMYMHEVRPGPHNITSSMSSTSKIRLIAEPGESYYVKCSFNMGFWS